MKHSPIYLDYQATTPVDPLVRTAMLPFFCDTFGNPHSVEHRFGWDAAEAVRVARAQVAGSINADDDEILFTSGATESCNLAIRGIESGSKVGARRRMITLSTEHAAVFETVLDLGRCGFETVVVPVESDGIINLEHLNSCLDERTLLVSVMAANNEIGVIQPIKEIAAMCHDVGALFHTDATQAVGTLAIDVGEWEVDLMSFSSHKIYGPKGIGALYVRSGLSLEPMLTGGGQERGIRGGTLPTPQIVGFGAACNLLSDYRDEEQSRIRALAGRLYEDLRRDFPNLRLFGDPGKRLGGNLCLGIPGLSSDELIRGVSDELAISSGSACTSATVEPSRVLLALGLPAETAATAFRISIGRFTTNADIDVAVSVLSRFATEKTKEGRW